MSDDSFRYCTDPAADDDEEQPIEGVTYTMSEAQFFAWMRAFITADNDATADTLNEHKRVYRLD